MVRTKAITPYLFIAPLVAILLLIFGYPLVKIFDFSFKRIRGFDGPYIGTGNFESLFKDPVFGAAVTHNLQLLLAVFPLLLVSLIIAIALYERLRGWRFFRTVVFLPYVLAVPIVGVVLKNMFQFNGPINQILRAAGLDNLALDWLGDKNIAIWTVLTMIVWRESAFGIILFVSRLLSLNEELTEAAQLDGADWWQRTWYIVVPQLKGVIEFYLVIGLITMAASVFAYVYIVPGKGAPANGTMVLELYIYNWAFEKHLPGIASAASVLLFVVTATLMFVLFYIRRNAASEELQ
ncbi:MAG: ABC transporter permease subunit [Anaerolineaceae bacterium]|nr:ABC transporter permease subunit [Anaerolineaceae bacterium]